jgi:hypothetical protein
MIRSFDGYEQCRAGYRPPIVVGDSPPYEFYAKFPTFYDAIDVGFWAFIFRSLYENLLFQQHCLIPPIYSIILNILSPQGLPMI